MPRTTSALLLCALLGACEERDRLVAPSPGDGIGPSAVIDVPGRDTTITPGGAITVAGFVRDPDGVDTIYFRTFGPVPSIPPVIPGDQPDSVRLGINLGTSGLSADTITVLIFATDTRGNRGDTAVREIYLP